MAAVLRRPLFEGTIFELAADAVAFRFFSVPRVTRLAGEAAFGGEWSSLLVAEEEVCDFVCFGGGDWCLVGDERCSGVRVSAVESVGGAVDSGSVSWCWAG